MKHLKLFEDFESGIISISLDGKEYTFTLSQKGKKIYLKKDDEIYQRLDIEIPDSQELEEDEFFMAPDVKKEIVNELIGQGFIQKLNKESIAGNKKVNAYSL